MSHSVNMTCQTMTCTNLEQNPLFVGVYSVVFIFGLTLNLTALVVFFRNSKSRSHTTMYMTHLAFADLLLVCTLPVRIYFHSGLGKSLPRSMCEFTGLIMLGNMYSSIFLLTCISFDRCIAVCFPLSSRVRECRKKAWCVCLGIWILTITTSLPIYFRKKKDYQKYNITCFGGFPSYATEKAPLVSTLILGFGIPLIIMILSSWGLIRAISKSTAVQTSDLVDSVRIKRMIITNLAIFLFCFLPYHIMLLILHASECSCLLLKAYRYSLMVACLNAMLDPVAYYFTTETFRRKMDVKAVRKITVTARMETTAVVSHTQHKNMGLLNSEDQLSCLH